VPFQSQPTRFVTRVDRDIFDGLDAFIETNVALWPMIIYFLEKNLHGPTFANSGSLG
jgi:hypothetical protein